MNVGGAQRECPVQDEPAIEEERRLPGSPWTRWLGRTVSAPAHRLPPTLARVPHAAWACALVAFVNAACWSVVTPPLLGLDEPDHFAYVQHLAETGSLPHRSSAFVGYSSEEIMALQDLRDDEVRFRPEGHLIATDAEQRQLQSDLARPLPRRGTGYVGVAASQPPLYYALETIPYRLASGGSILDRLESMRLLSALLAGATALFVFLFLREALPGARWAWIVGGLGVAFTPLLGYASSTVNPDSLTIALCAALFYCLARAFRRGLTRGLALAIGALLAAGIATKLNFIGVLPGAVAGTVLAARRQARVHGLRAYGRLLAPVLLIGLSPAALYALVNLSSHHPLFGFLSGGISTVTGAHRSLWGQLAYMWQFYLPRLPGMPNDFGEIFSARQIWFRDVVGLYGWSDVVFPAWVYNAALVAAGALALLFARGLAGCRRALRARAAELATYALMALGLLTLIAAAGYLAFPGRVAEFTDGRYLLPLLALWGAVLALAARGAGRRWGPVVGVLLVALVIAHDIFSELQVIARYYG
jgi:hypothetical protein